MNLTNIFLKEKIKFSLIAIFLFNIAIGLSQKKIDEGYINAVYSEYRKKTSPNIGIIIIKNDSLKLLKYYGYTNFKEGIEADENTVYNLSHLSKQFTCAAILILQKEGKLSLDDNIGKIMPELPDYMHQIKIRHLLNQTSGLPNVLKSLDKKVDVNKSYLLKEFNKHQSLLSDLGVKLAYNFTDYALLAKLIEEISDQTFDTFIKDKIFKPLKMNSSFVMKNNLSKKEKKKYPDVNLYSYVSKDSANMYNNKDLKYVQGNEGVYTTLGDYAKWEIALFNNTILSEEMVNMMFPKDDSAIKGIGYQYGWFNDFNRKKYYYLPCSDDYTTNIAVRIPDENISILIVVNRNGIPGLRKKAFFLVRQVSDVFYIMQ